jgi:heme A synthase
MKLDTEIKTAHLLTAMGLCILLGLLLAYIFTPRLIAKRSTVIDDTTSVYKIPENQSPTTKPSLPGQAHSLPSQK